MPIKRLNCMRQKILGSLLQEYCVANYTNRLLCLHHYGHRVSFCNACARGDSDAHRTIRRNQELDSKTKLCIAIYINLVYVKIMSVCSTQPRLGFASRRLNHELVSRKSRTNIFMTTLSKINFWVVKNSKPVYS